jgi:pimeloyl-ACP methyl ester carboxylesterase
MPAAVVLVHGAWHGSWAWDRVVPLVQAAGVLANAVDLPGRGNSHRALGDLHADAGSLTRLLDDYEDDSVILVGHSYGGAVITEAGLHPSVRHLVFIAALPLRSDETCGSAASEEAAGIDHSGRTDLGSGFVQHPDGTITLTPAVARACLYQDVDELTVEWALERLGPQPLIALRQSPDRVAWQDRPSTYVVCANDQAVHPGLQRVLAQRCGTQVEWPTGHSPFLTEPTRVAELLTTLAAA